jgi:hypothetical protein
MSDNERVVCSVCSAIRQTLHPKKSKLLKTTTLYLCSECVKGNKEPRWLIILVGRSKGPASVLEYIKHNRYDGEEISAKELISGIV